MYGQWYLGWYVENVEVDMYYQQIFLWMDGKTEDSKFTVWKIQKRDGEDNKLEECIPMTLICGGKWPLITGSKLCSGTMWIQWRDNKLMLKRIIKNIDITCQCNLIYTLKKDVDKESASMNI